MLSFPIDTSALLQQVIDTVIQTNKALIQTNKAVNRIKTEFTIQRNQRLNVWDKMSISSQVSRKENPGFKHDLIAFYECACDRNQHKIKCMVLNMFLPQKIVSASHIFPAYTRGKELDEYNLEENDLWNPRNGLLLYKTIEVAFDRMECCFLYLPFDQSIHIKILNPALLSQRVWQDKHVSQIPPNHQSLTFQDIDDQKLQLPKDRYPYRRILHLHAKFSVKRAVKQSWMTQVQSESFKTVFGLSDDANAKVPEDDPEASLPEL